jgi:hypothetical protein
MLNVQPPIQKSKTPFARGRHKCIFCGEYGSSNEHIFPLWLKRYFPRDSKTTHNSVYYSWPTGIITLSPKADRKNKQGHVGSLKTKTVCKKCNTGWMHNLEDRVRPTLISLFQANTLRFTADLQSNIATWCVKTCMTAEQVHPNSAEFPQSDRTLLMERLAPPPNWFVWVGHYRGEAWQNLSYGQNRGGLDSRPVANSEHARHSISASVMGIGRIIFLVVKTSAPDITQKLNGFELANPFNQPALPQIWPPKERSIVWPLFTVMGDEEANGLANFFKTSGLFDHSYDPSANWTFTMP